MKGCAKLPLNELGWSSVAGQLGSPNWHLPLFEERSRAAVPESDGREIILCYVGSIWSDVASSNYIRAT